MCSGRLSQLGPQLLSGALRLPLLLLSRSQLRLCIGQLTLQLLLPLHRRNQLALQCLTYIARSFSNAAIVLSW
jgi:hypothetical protein